MIGVFINGVRIGLLLKFPHLKLPWCAYSHGSWKQSFRTRKEAVAWLASRHDLLFAHAAKEADAAAKRIAGDFEIDPALKRIPTRGASKAPSTNSGSAA